MRFSLAVVPLLLAAATGSSLVGLFRNSSSGKFTCQLLRIDPATGANVSFSPNVRSCGLASSIFPSFSAYNPVTNALVVAIQSAPTLFSYDLKTGVETPGAALPQNSSDPFQGLVTVSSPSGGSSFATFLVTQNNVYKTTDGSTWSHFADASFPANTQVTVDAAAGAAGVLYVADEASGAIYTLDLSSGAAGSLTSGVDSPWDVQYSATTGTLIEVGSYQLYSTNVATGASKKLWNVPDGPGYPRVNGISQDGSVFFFFDFATIYTVDVVALQVLTKVPFTWAPRVVGYPILVD